MLLWERQYKDGDLVEHRKKGWTGKVRKGVPVRKKLLRLIPYTEWRYVIAPDHFRLKLPAGAAPREAMEHELRPKSYWKTTEAERANESAKSQAIRMLGV